MKTNHLSYAASVNTLKRFFANTAGTSVTPEQIYMACGRDLTEKARNKSWLSNRTHAMKDHDLFVKKYATGGFHEFNRLVLTEKGIRELNKIAGAEQSSAQPQTITLQAIADIVDEFNRQNPSWEIEVLPKRVTKEVVEQL